MRGSLQGRFLVISLVTGLGVLLLAGYAIGEVIRDVVMDGAEEIFTAQQVRMREAIDADGRFHSEQVLFLKGFTQHPDLWGWSVTTPRGTWQSGATAHIIELARAGDESGGKLQLARGETANGHAVHMHMWHGTTGNGKPLAVTLIGSDRPFQDPFTRSRLRLWSALGVFALALIGLVMIQWRYGFAPLRTLQGDLAAVRAGRMRLLSEDLPDELRALAGEINALIAQNEAGLQHARLNLANLAHSLKTPLATLSLRLPREGASDKSLELLQQLDTRVRHHLGRARSAALSSGERVRCEPAHVVARLVEVMHILMNGRELQIANEIDPCLTLAIDGEDLDEMLGNLLENATRFARNRITVRGYVAERSAHLVVEDDGPGLDAEDMSLAMEPGRRLAEDGVGFGFGLGLVAELASLYGGDLVLSRSSDLGGLRADLELPLHME